VENLDEMLDRPVFWSIVVGGCERREVHARYYHGVDPDATRRVKSH
jgi:hypothetical protein